MLPRGALPRCDPPPAVPAHREPSGRAGGTGAGPRGHGEATSLTPQQLTRGPALPGAVIAAPGAAHVRPLLHVPGRGPRRPGRSSLAPPLLPRPPRSRCRRRYLAHAALVLLGHGEQHPVEAVLLLRRLLRAQPHPAAAAAPGRRRNRNRRPRKREPLPTRQSQRAPAPLSSLIGHKGCQSFEEGRAARRGGVVMATGGTGRGSRARPLLVGAESEKVHPSLLFSGPSSLLALQPLPQLRPLPWTRSVSLLQRGGPSWSQGSLSGATEQSLPTLAHVQLLSTSTSGSFPLGKYGNFGLFSLDLLSLCKWQHFPFPSAVFSLRDTTPGPSQPARLPGSSSSTTTRGSRARPSKQLLITQLPGCCCQGRATRAVERQAQTSSRVCL